MSKTIHTLTPVCPSCGDDQIEGHYNYCSMCAHDLEPYKHECPFCKRRHLIQYSHYNFCGTCGADLRDTVEFVYPSGFEAA